MNDQFTSKLAELTHLRPQDMDDGTEIAPAEWDSVEVLDLIAAIDDTFGTTVPLEALMRCRNVGELRELIRKQS